MTLPELLKAESATLRAENEALKKRLDKADQLLLAWLKDCNKPFLSRSYIKVVPVKPRKPYIRKKL